MNGTCRQDTLLDRFIIGFAVWTLAHHLTLLLSGHLGVLLAIFVVLGMGAIIIHRKLLPPTTPHPSPPSGIALRFPPAFLLLFVLIAAVLVSITYRTGALHPLCWSTIAFLIIAAVLHKPEPAATATATSPTVSLSAFWWLAAAGALLALAMHRPDLDDCFHVSTAVMMADHPHLPIMGQHSIIYNGPATFWLVPIWKVQSLESLVGAVSFLTGTEALLVFHLLVGGTAAFLSILSIGRLYRTVVPRHAFWCLLAAVLFLMASGAGNVSLGNMGLPRMHQGKAFFLTGIVPLVFVYGLRFGQTPSVRSFLILLLSQITSIGLTSTAVWAAPVAAATGVLCGIPFNRRAVFRLFLGALSAAYPLMIGLIFMSPMKTLLTQLPEMSNNQIDTLVYAYLLVLSREPTALISVFFVITAWICAPTGLARRVALVLPCFFFATFFNPALADTIAGNAVGHSLYYRTLWTLQIPILAGLVLASPTWLRPRSSAGIAMISVLSFPLIFMLFVYTPSLPKLLAWKAGNPAMPHIASWNALLLLVLLCPLLLAVRRLSKPTRIRTLIFVTTILACFILMPTRYVLSPYNALYDARFRFTVPGRKVDPVPHEVARFIASHTPAGRAVAAPLTVSAWIPTFHRHPLPVMARVNHLSYMALALTPADAALRHKLVTAVGQVDDSPFSRGVLQRGRQKLAAFGESVPDTVDAVAVLTAGLKHYDLTTICLAGSNPDVTHVLLAHDFTLAHRIPPYDIWLRTPAPTDPTP